ncbi:1-acyl-sn-glycerol-3-phosphate acyltransferase [Haloferula helveola]|uniref:1-acyl-sn-glycerol-3-phosphate acyltransferase n=1 Tax=Haloferula helveola TaxID=490095 RepID=A0ABM7RA39_9BACT|nr:1-acyl-sn-glycerol-3-phosphate acyltransferase [Haloferula helveola]
MIAASRTLARPTPPASWIEHLVPPDRVPRRWETVLHHLTWSFVRFGVTHRFQLAIRGTDNIPASGPVVMVANHNSHLDTLLLASAVPRSLRARLSPLAAGDTFFPNPTQGWISSRFLNLRPLWRHQRGPHGLLRLRECLQSQDQCFLIYPEGTRSRSGVMGHFKPGIGTLVAGTPIPVIPCHIRGTFEAWPSSKRLPSHGDLQLVIGQPRTFPHHSNTAADWRDIAHTLEDDVRELGDTSH